MSASELPALVAVFLVPFVAALALGPPALLGASRLVRLCVPAALAAVLIALGGLMRLELTRGGWERVPEEAFAGHAFVARDLSGAPAWLAEPAILLLVLAFALAGLLLLLPGESAGPPPRRIAAASLPLVRLCTLGACFLALLGNTFDWLVYGWMLASCGTSALQVLRTSSRDDAESAARLFLWHRVGDACMGAAWLLWALSFSSLELDALGSLLGTLDPWTRLEQGPLVGFPVSTLHGALCLLWLLALATRLPLGPLPWMRVRWGVLPHGTLDGLQILAGPALAVACAYKLAPLLWGAPALHAAFALLAALGALYACFVAALTHDLARIDAQLLSGTLCVALCALALGAAEVALLLCVLAVLAAPLLSTTTAMLAGASGGNTDIRERHGLGRWLPLLDRARVLATLSFALPGGAFYLALVELIRRADQAPFLRGALLLSLAMLLPLVAYASFRWVHALLSARPGTDALPPPAPAEARRANLHALPLIPTALALLIGGVVFAAPADLVGRWVLGFQPPLRAYLAPSLAWLPAPFAALADASSGVARLGGLGGEAGLLAFYVGLALWQGAGYLASWFLCRGGPAAPLAHLRQAWEGHRVIVASTRADALETLLSRAALRVLWPAAHALRATLHDFLFGSLITRLTSLVSALTRIALRVVHGGDIQRAWIVALLAASWFLWRWGQS